MNLIAARSKCSPYTANRAKERAAESASRHLSTNPAHREEFFRGIRDAPEVLYSSDELRS
jgi:hypothetical protein